MHPGGPLLGPRSQDNIAQFGSARFESDAAMTHPYLFAKEDEPSVGTNDDALKVLFAIVCSPVASLKEVTDDVCTIL